MNEIQQILNSIIKKGGTAFAGADLNDIDFASNTLIASNLPPIPNELADFLQSNDGFYFNGFELYGVFEHRHEKELFSLPSLVQVNEEWIVKNKKEGWLAVATYHDDILFYWQNVLHRAPRYNFQPFEIYNSLSEAIMYLLDIKL